MSQVIVTYVNGGVEEYETQDKLSVSQGVLVISQGGDNHVAINMAHVRKWEVVAGKIAVAGKLVVAGGLQ